MDQKMTKTFNFTEKLETLSLSDVDILIADNIKRLYSLDPETELERETLETWERDGNSHTLTKWKYFNELTLEWVFLCDERSIMTYDDRLKKLFYHGTIEEVKG